MIMCRPDLSYSVVRYSQYSSKLHEIHYHAVSHMLKYLYQTHTGGIYYWRATPNMLLPKVPPHYSAMHMISCSMAAPNMLLMTFMHTWTWNGPPAQRPGDWLVVLTYVSLAAPSHTNQNCNQWLLNPPLKPNLLKRLTVEK